MHIRWMVHRDFPQVLEIEQASFESPWTECMLRAILKERNTIGIVVDEEGEILGYAIYEVDDVLFIKTLAVRADKRRHGIGRQIIRNFVRKLPSGRRDCLEMLIRERNLAGQLFLRACGFQAVETRHFEDYDAYLFRYVLTCPLEFAPVNRVGGFWE